MAVTARVVDSGCLPRQFGPIGDEAVVGRRLLGILPLVGADVVEAIGEILDRLGLGVELLEQDCGVVRDAVLLM